MHRNHGSSHSTRQMEGKLVWGGLTVPARLHPLTTDCAEQGHGGRWFWDRSMSKERQRSWERVWNRSFKMSNWGSCGYVAWKKRRFKGDLISLYNSLKGVCSKMGANLLSQVTGQEEMAWGCARRSLDWIVWKISSQERGYQALEQAAQASGGVTIPECI